MATPTAIVKRAETVEEARVHLEGLLQEQRGIPAQLKAAADATDSSQLSKLRLRAHEIEAEIDVARVMLCRLEIRALEDGLPSLQEREQAATAQIVEAQVATARAEHALRDAQQQFRIAQGNLMPAQLEKGEQRRKIAEMRRELQDLLAKAASV